MKIVQIKVTDRIVRKIAAALLVIFLVGCSATKRIYLDPEKKQLTFRTAEQGVEALNNAVASNSRQDLQKIFGPQADQLLYSGDSVADATAIKTFAAGLAERRELATVSVEEKGKPNMTFAVLIVGNENWPFPISLVRENNRWRFDTENGKEEILSRRIGRNEIGALSVCGGYVEAQQEYFRGVGGSKGARQYAQRFFSTPGKRDGLYWESAPGAVQSPLGPLVARAENQGYTAPTNGKSVPYRGYYYRILTAQGKSAPGGAKSYLQNGKMTKGFALVAYPAEWGSSGIMTFIVGPDGVVLQKNLGEQTNEQVSKLNSFNPESGWVPVAEFSGR